MSEMLAEMNKCASNWMRDVDWYIPWRSVKLKYVHDSATGGMRNDTHVTSTPTEMRQRSVMSLTSTSTR